MIKYLSNHHRETVLTIRNPEIITIIYLIGLLESCLLQRHRESPVDMTKSEILILIVLIISFPR